MSDEISDTLVERIEDDDSILEIHRIDGLNDEEIEDLVKEDTLVKELKKEEAIDINLADFGLDVPFLSKTGVANIKGDILDLSELRNAAEDVLKDVAKNSIRSGKDRLGPIGEWMQNFVTQSIPAIGKFYAQHVFTAKNRKRQPDDIAKIEHAAGRVRTFINREKAALKIVLRAVDLELTNIVEEAFWAVVEKIIPIFLKLGPLALSFLVPGLNLR